MHMTLMPAQPSSEQAAHFARLAQIASDQFFSHLFGPRAQSVLSSMFQEPNNDNSHVYTTFLQEGDEIAGMLQAYPAIEARRCARRSNWLYLRHASWQIPRALAVGIRLGSVLEFLGSDLDDGDFYIAMLAIYPQFRRRGHSQTLLNHAEDLAATHDCSRLALDVDERNHIARAVYRHAGFQRIAQSKKADLAGERLSVLRLAKLLSPNLAPTAPAK